MQIILTIGLTLTLGFSLLQCEKAASSKSETAKTNQTTAQANEQITAPVTVATPEEAPRISLADAKKEFDAGTAIFVDTRAEVTYKTEHIKGAINIPAEAFQTRYNEVPKNKKIIAYCS